MTPFELSLENDLHIEWQRFASEWLFKWYGMTYEGGRTDVEDFRGGRIRYGGGTFGDQQQQIFWQAINRYLILKVHETFKRWDADTQAYPSNIRRASIDGVERALGRFVATILQDSLDTDRRLRGRGFPENVSAYDTSGQASTGGAEIHRLAHAHRTLLDEQISSETSVPVLSRKQRIEMFLSNHKGIMAAIGLLIGAIGLAKYFFQ
jgi:hypothetical protein